MALLTNINGKFSVSDAGAVTFNNAFTFPTADGTANYVLKTNGSGQLAWAADNYENYDYWILQGDSASNVNINSTNTLKFVGGTYIDTSATWAGGSNARKLTINHETTSRTDTTSTDAPAFGGTFEAVTSVSTNSTGHVTAIDVSTITIPTDPGGTVKGTGTATRVAFWSASDTITSDADLYWDNTNKRLGIGTTGPSAKLDVQQGTAGNIISAEFDNLDYTVGNRNAIKVRQQVTAGGSYSAFLGVDKETNNIFLSNDSITADHLVIDTSGNVGIGATSPGAKLEVAGATNIKGTSNFAPVLTLGTAGAINAVINSADEMFFNIDSNNNQTSAAFWFGHNSTQGDTSSKLMVIKDSGRVGIGTDSPSVGLQLGNSTLGETKTAIFNSEGGGEVGLTVQSRTNRAKLRVADNDSNAYVVAEGGHSFFGNSANGDTQNLMITPNGYMSFGSVSEIASLYIQSSFTDAPAVKFYNSNTLGDGLFVEVAASSSSEFALKVTANGGLTNVLYARADGNVGINTTSPDYKLDVSGNIRSSTLTVYDGMGGTETGIGASAAGGNLRLYTAGVNKVTVTNTAQSLILYGNSTTGSNYIQFKDSQGTSQGYLGYGSSGSNVLYLVQQKSDDIQFYSNGSTRMTINTDGNIGIGVSPESGMVSYIKQLRIGEQSGFQGHADGVGQDSATWVLLRVLVLIGNFQHQVQYL